jgi:hypothetical protein
MERRRNSLIAEKSGITQTTRKTSKMTVNVEINSGDSRR